MVMNIGYIMTVKPLNFIHSIDFATLKNDSDTQTITLTLPATVVTKGVPALFSQTYEVGVSGAPMDYEMNYSMGPQKWISNFIQAVENYNTPNVYNVAITIFRTGATTVKIKANIYYNGAAATVTTNARTITVKLRTYIPPFTT